MLQTELSDGREITLTQTTDYPWDGEVRFSIDRLEPGQPFSIRFRIPGWAKGASITVNGTPVSAKAEPSSYAQIKRRWQLGDVVELDLPMPVRLMVADHRVEQARGQVAVMRGPVVYCLESTDLPDGVAIEEVHLPRAAEWTVRHKPDLLRGVTVLETEALVVPGPDPSAGLYQDLPSEPPHRMPIQRIPYYAWNNRGEPKMTVWIPLY